MLSRRNILHVITGLYVGGAEMMLARLTDTMVLQGFAAEVVSLMRGGPIGAQLTGRGIPVDYLGMRQGLPSVSGAWRLSGLARRARPDLVQGWMYHGNLAASWAARSVPGGVPVVWNIRHSLYDLALESRLTRLIILLGAKLSRRPAAIIYNSQTSARQHEGVGYTSRRSVVIPNGFDCERFQPQPEARERLRKEIGLEPSALLVGMVARNHPMKDLGNLLQSIALLRAEGVDVQLVIAGRGFDAGNAAVKKAIARFALEAAVRLLGERSDVHRILPGLDILALPSAWGEGFPNILGEAMASGVACVTTDIGDSRWILGGHGLVVPPRDAAAMAAAMRELITLGTDGRHRLGEAGRARVIADFSLSDVAKRYATLYSDVLGGSAFASTAV